MIPKSSRFLDDLGSPDSVLLSSVQHRRFQCDRRSRQKMPYRFHTARSVSLLRSSSSTVDSFAASSRASARTGDVRSCGNRTTGRRPRGRDPGACSTSPPHPIYWRNLLASTLASRGGLLHGLVTVSSHAARLVKLFRSPETSLAHLLRT